MKDEISEYGQKPVAVDLQRVKAEDVPGLMELVGSAASESATVNVRFEWDEWPMEHEINYQAIEEAMVLEIASWNGSKRPSRFWDESSSTGRAARIDLAKAVLIAAGVLPKPEEPSATE